MRAYGNLTNRFEEGKKFTPDNQIHVNDDVTMYYWSDRTCFYVTKVVDQKHIFVKPYYVCADHEKPRETGHQDWVYFKSIKEHHNYLKKYSPDRDFEENPKEDSEQEWVFRYGNWKRASRRNYQNLLDEIAKIKEIDKKNNRTRTEEEYLDRALNRLTSNKTNYEKLKAGKEIIEYVELRGKVSFGVLDHYYDWEF